MIKIKKYLRLPTHTKYGWLVFLLGFLATGLLSMLLGGEVFISGILQWAFIIAFIIEVVAKLLGKNKEKE